MIEGTIFIKRGEPNSGLETLNLNFTEEGTFLQQGIKPRSIGCDDLTSTPLNK
jgi:hypothetical protein